MQNVQNADIQRVMNLVDFYRTKVGGKDSDNYRAIKEYVQTEEQRQIEAQKKEHAYSFTTSVAIPEDMANKIKVNEHLLGHFYIKALGDRADVKVANRLFANFYDDNILTTCDEDFLTSHFKEMVNYIISTPCEQLSSKDWDEKDIFFIPQEVLDMVCEHIKLPSNALVYNPFAGFAQFATRLNDCNFICEDSYSVFNEQNNKIDDYHDVSAWTAVALIANGVSPKIIENKGNLSYDAVISYVPFIPVSHSNGEKIFYDEKFELFLSSILLEAYNCLKLHGKMGLLIPKDILWRGNKHYCFKNFWETLIQDGSLSEIIQLPPVMSYNCPHDYCLVLITKKSTYLTSITDARYASKEIANANVISMNDFNDLIKAGKVKQFLETGVSMKAIKKEEDNVLFAKNGESNFIEVLDIERLKATEINGGKDPETGLRKMVKVGLSCLNVDLLIPQAYVIEKPLDVESPVSLSTLCSMVNTRICDVKYNLPNDTRWIKEKNLSYTFQGELDLTSNDIETADCPNLPPHTDSYVFNENNELDSELPWSQKTELGRRVLDYRDCYLLDGSKDAVLYKYNENGAKLALLRATGKPLAVDNSIFVFTPNETIDALKLYVLLNMPLVYRQVQVFRDFGIQTNLHNVLVPLDKRIIKDAERIALNEESTYKSHEEKLFSMKTEYINEVRMRKHDMGQYIFELVNIEDLMRYYVENRDKEQNFCQELETLLDNFRSSLGELSTLLDNLSKEEQFDDPEIFNMTEFLSGLEKRHTKDSYKIQYSCDLPSIKKYNRKRQMKQQAELDAINHQMMMEDMKQQAELDAINHQMMMEDMKQQAELDAINHQMMMEDMKQQAELDAINHQMMMEDMKQQAELDAINDQMMKDDMKRHADTETPLTMSFVIGRDNGISANASMYMPPIYVAPNDFQRLVNNILNNAKRHGFTNPNKKDYVVQINASIDAESGMYQIDFRNNGDPLPEGMNKMRYGLKGEKAGKTAGTGLGGNYVKSFVEHYGGDYDIFMEDGWTVVRICLPIK